MSKFFEVRKTRFKELGFWQIEPGCWSFVDLTGDKPAQVGQHYLSKEMLLHDLERYAAEFGCEGAAKDPLKAEMLDALKQIAKAYFPNADQMAESLGEERLHPAVQKVRAAIAKAEGK